MSAVQHIPLDFLKRLKYEVSHGCYICPVCGNPSLDINRSDSQNIRLECSTGCKQGSILSALHQPAIATIYIPQEAPNIKRRLTLEGLNAEIMGRGWTLRHNILTGKYEGENETGENMPIERMIARLHSDLGDSYKNITPQVLQLYTAEIAKENQYNPVLEYLDRKDWDGQDHILPLLDLMGLPEHDWLSRALVRKWLFQTMAMLYNGRDGVVYGAEGVLSLTGAQGTGKTSLFRHLAIKDEWFKEGACIKNYDKDTARRCLTRWIVELGEVESTLKSDIEELKAFVTSAQDAYRLPYGREDIETERRASLCATCNSEAYLIDTTGNRRWFTVPINQPIPIHEIKAFDALQLWLQIQALIKDMTPHEMGACFRLSADEREALIERNSGYEKPVKAGEEVRDIIETARAEGHVFQYMTVTAWKEQYPELSRYSSQQVSAALKQIGIEQKRIRINGSSNASRTYELPSRVTAGQAFKVLK